MVKRSASASGGAGALAWAGTTAAAVVAVAVGALLVRTLPTNLVAMDSAKKRLGPIDPNSYARPDEAKVTDVLLKLDVNFEAKVLAGAVTLTVERASKSVKHVLLDASDLSVSSVKDDVSGAELAFEMHPPEFCGSKLQVSLPDSDAKTVNITLAYRTSSTASALQWLSPAQTAGKKHPYMFSQCQAIHCRSMVPLQDTPAIKTPYRAEITAPADLTVLMSAVPQGEPQVVDGGKKRLFKFYQKIPIQSYLIAIAVGKLESRKIGPRSHVWSEKEFVDKAAAEFSETEKMLQKAEELCGPYVWGIYDILVLPPSFPYGGMENPCVTFATPTLLAGDKSLANVIAHEIAHSWTGNLVTNKNFEHFWLNEGFTVFTERKIGGRLESEAHRHFEAIGGWKELAYTVDVLGKESPLTSLVVDLSGIDPDDAFSTVPYEKGSAFLWYLEETVGGKEKMEPFLRSYYDKFKYQSIDSNDFKNYFLEYFKGVSAVSSIDWDTWFNAPGMPKHKPKYDDSLAKVCLDLKDKWLSWDAATACPFTAADLANFSSGQKIEFLAQLLADGKPLGVEKLQKMDELYALSGVANCEIRFRWIRLGLTNKWLDAVPRAVQMVTEQGRMKYLRPIYRDLYNWEEQRQVALDTFNKNKGSMMNVAVKGLSADLKINTP